MSGEASDLAVVEAALKAATPGPWETWPHTHIEDDCRCLSCQFVTVWQTRNSLDCEDVPRKPGESERCEASGYSWEDANLIANAPTWLAELVERVKVAEAAVASAKADGWDERDRARASYLGPDNGHYEDCMGWEDCYCATYPNPYRALDCDA